MRYSYFQSFDHLVRRRALREEWLEGVEGEGEGDDGDGGRHDDDALHPHPVGGNSENGIRIFRHLMKAGNLPRATMM